MCGSVKMPSFMNGQGKVGWGTWMVWEKESGERVARLTSDFYAHSHGSR